MFDLSGRIALVVGGSGGIGEACATALAGQGSTVVLAARRADSLAESAARIGRETGRAVETATVNASDESSVEALVREVVARHGRLDILVCAQGYNYKAPALEFPAEEWDRLFEVNVKGTMLLCKHAGRVMKERRYGRVINLSSVRGVRANAGGNAGYCATKAAVDMITRCLAAEWAPFGITVNAIAPSLMATKFTEKQMAEPGRTEAYLRNVPLGRLATPQDLVGAVVLLASDESRFITGQIFYVDGGLTAIG